MPVVWWRNEAPTLSVPWSSTGWTWGMCSNSKTKYTIMLQITCTLL